MKIIYLAAHIAKHPNWNMTYQDITGKRDIGGDMLETDLTPYDVIIATPPCNYYSRANYRREKSEYSQKTKHLLPEILNKLIKLNKPFLVENVQHGTLYNKVGLFDYPLFIYTHGRHTYWTNVYFNPSNIKQKNDNVEYTPKHLRQGGKNVHDVIEYWLENVKEWLDA
jgi:site-specific DNA-cytosine methylase